MKPTVERLAEQFTKLIGPEAFAKAEAAIAAAKLAAEAAAKAAAEKAAAAAAAAKAAAAAAPKPAVVAGLGEPGQPGSPAPATPRPAPAPRPAVAAAVPPRPAAPAPAPAAAPMPTLPVQVTSHLAKGYHFEATVAPSQVVEAAQLLDAEGFALDTITGVDWIAQNEMEIVYDYFHPIDFLRVVVRTRAPRATPELPSITSVFGGANWHEREAHDFFGIRFTGHPNLKPFLLPEDANFHPLRKDYQP